MKFKNLIPLVIVLLVYQFCFASTNSVNIAGYQYVKYKNEFHVIDQYNNSYSIDTNKVIVHLKDTKQNIDDILLKINAPTLKDVRGKFAGDFIEFQIPSKINSIQLLKQFESSGYFDVVHFNVFGKLHAIEPNDTYYQNFLHWNLDKISMPNAWTKSTGNNNIKVAVIDVGTDYSHIDLVKNKWSSIGYDFIEGDNNPYPENILNSKNAHGTCVTGIICSDLNNNEGVSGIAGGWNLTKGVQFISLRAGEVIGMGQEEIDNAAAVAAISYAINNGAKVINCSWGVIPTEEMAFVINNAVENKRVIVASTGNYYKESQNNIKYPASSPYTIAVGATIGNDKRKTLNDGADITKWGSCYGSEIDAVAPGINIPTTDIEGQYGYSSDNYNPSFRGTSAAAPHVAALASLIASINPDLTFYEIRDIIRNTASKVGGYTYVNNFNENMGYGRINAYAALNATPLPLSVNISGPTFLAGDNGTFTANASGGTTPYINYKWWYRNDGVIGMKAPPVGTWVYISHYEGQSSISYGPDFCFSLKCIVTDSNNNTAEDIHSVTVIDGLKKDISDPNDLNIPSSNKLKPNYPNPFNPSTTIEYDLSENSDVVLSVMSISGHIVKEWEFIGQNPGTYRIQWDGRKDNGQELTSGMYIYQLKTSNFLDTKKMVYMK